VSEKIMPGRMERTSMRETLSMSMTNLSHDLEESRPHKSFRTVSGDGLLAMEELGCLPSRRHRNLTSGISLMPPFSEVSAHWLNSRRRASSFASSLIQMTIHRGNVAQLGATSIE